MKVALVGDGKIVTSAIVRDEPVPIGNTRQKFHFNLYGEHVKVLLHDIYYKVQIGKQVITNSYGEHVTFLAHFSWSNENGRQLEYWMAVT